MDTEEDDLTRWPEDNDPESQRGEELDGWEDADA